MKKNPVLVCTPMNEPVKYRKTLTERPHAFVPGILIPASFVSEDKFNWLEAAIGGGGGCIPSEDEPLSSFSGVSGGDGLIANNGDNDLFPEVDGVVRVAPEMDGGKGLRDKGDGVKPTVLAAPEVGSGMQST